MDWATLETLERSEANKCREELIGHLCENKE